MSDTASKQYTTPDRLAARQALHVKYANVDWFAWVTEHMGLRAGERVLDVGCGPGSFWRAALPLLPSVLDLTLTDLSPSMVETARNVSAVADARTTITCLQADAAALAFPDAQFDAALAMHMLYHLEEPARALGELRRVLRAGGRCYVATNGSGNMVELRKLAERAFGRPDGEWDGRRCELDDVERLMRATFVDVTRHDLHDVMLVTDPDDLIAYLLSTPQADRSGSATRDAVERCVLEAMQAGGGTFAITKRLGMVEGQVRSPS